MKEERIVVRNGKRYRVTNIEHTQVMPWGTEPVSYCTTKWELIGPEQLNLFE